MLTPCGPPGLLLSRRAELKPLRVYGEQAEASEFPAPGVSSRGPPRKSPGEGRPNPSLRFALQPPSVPPCCLHWVEGRGLGPGPGGRMGLMQVPPPPRSITLHHRIRQAPNPYASDIKAFDARLQKREIFSKEDLKL